MRVGDEYRVFEVLEKGQEYWSECEGILGMQVCERYPNSDNHCPDVIIHNGNEYINLSPGLKQSKHVATMRITKIK